MNCSQPRSPSTRGTKGGDGGGKEEKRKDARMRALINGGPLQLRDSEPYHRSRRVDFPFLSSILKASFHRFDRRFQAIITVEKLVLLLRELEETRIDSVVINNTTIFHMYVTRVVFLRLVEKTVSFFLLPVHRSIAPADIPIHDL